MISILKKIVEDKRKRVNSLKASKPIDLKNIDNLKRGNYFSKNMSSGKVNIIAEIKKASPSKGIFRSDFNPYFLLDEYEKGGASAISILTEEKYFLGSSELFSELRKKTSLPLLRKDFIIDEYQIYESVIMGADAILLIASILEEKTLKSYLELANSFGLDCLVEIHNEEELDKALKCGAGIIGVNARDLKTFKVDINLCAEIIKRIPQNIIKVAESGIMNKGDIEYLRSSGADAYLVGERLVLSEKPSEILRSWCGDESEN